MSCERKKDQVCQRVGAAYGLTGQGGSNVATTVWAGGLLKKWSPTSFSFPPLPGSKKRVRSKKRVKVKETGQADNLE